MSESSERRTTMNFSELTISDYIELFGIFISFATSIIAIVISIKTLKQNSKMIEDSTRPNIGIYLASTYIRNVSCYLVVKNFGQSSAFIESFTYDFDLKSTSNVPHYNPFDNIEGSTLMPSQTNKCVIDLNKVLEQTHEINFHVTYRSGTHKYQDTICVKLDSRIGNFVKHNTSKDKEVAIISETLQDAYISSL